MRSPAKVTQVRGAQVGPTVGSRVPELDCSVLSQRAPIRLHPSPLGTGSPNLCEKPAVGDISSCLEPDGDNLQPCQGGEIIYIIQSKYKVRGVV